jgi:peptide/nickel transport system substrate-binding protein
MEAAGFRVTFDVMDWNKLIDVSLKGRPSFPQYHGVNVSRALQEPFSGLFRFMMSSQFSPNGGNWGHFATPEGDALIAKIYETFDETERTKLIVQAHEMFSEQAGMVFITHDLNPRALSPKLTGFVQAQSWFQDLTPIVVNGGTN